ncbi:patatin-like phospholipase family protein [Undibacterium sp. CY7W]|uniref:Patatin-like phospholipase family protein n=1 Tax=Undibacterium rugosum TaxID=2762291 RepID=A0A923KY80_9BURK|nr:patatin-like phospholipase family protein [Undibacterium rugosum]MBC3933993.1 patatin-like phospholipase family protein [Undibacterium rugosum]
MKRRLMLAMGAGLPLLSHAAQKNVSAVQTAPARSLKLGLALGGGSARGFAHIGVIQALEKHKIRPDLVVGTSAGSIIGAFYAAGFSGTQMEEVAMKIRDFEIADISAGSRRGMVVGNALQNLVNQYLQNKPIESFATPFYAVATNLVSGKLHLFRSGNAGFAVRASCSMPGIFIPARLGSEEFVDGGLISPLPVAEAKKMGADYVIAVDVSASADNVNLHGMFELLMQSFDIMGQSLIRMEAEKADVVIHPDLRKFSSTDFQLRKELIAAGYQAGLQAIPQIKAALAKD